MLVFTNGEQSLHLHSCFAQVVPIYKGGPNDLCTNYRPMSLLSPTNKFLKNFSTAACTPILSRMVCYLVINMVLEWVYLQH